MLSSYVNDSWGSLIFSVVILLIGAAIAWIYQRKH
jgi:hypothetical protein